MTCDEFGSFCVCFASRRRHTRCALVIGVHVCSSDRVVCTEAGLSLDAALERVAREIAGNSMMMADELGHAVIELRFLPEHRKALENLAQRTAVVPGSPADRKSTR